MDARLSGMLEAYFADCFDIRNEDGKRGYADGIRVLGECPVCGDAGGRSWYHAAKGKIGCFRDSCDAYGSMSALQAVRQREGFASNGQAIIWLAQQYPNAELSVVPPQPVRQSYIDWCRLPVGFTSLSSSLSSACGATSPLHQEAFRFAKKQWGIEDVTLAHAGAGICVRGRYVWRIVLPIRIGGALVAFQARSYRGGEPKYLTSSHGEKNNPMAECGRPAEALLYNLDAVTPGARVVLVEGIGDVLACRERRMAETPVAILGVEMMMEKVAMLAMYRPGPVIVAMDGEPGALRRGAEHVGILQACGVDASLYTWSAKDAGSGAKLQKIGSGLAARMMGVLNG
jgi:hypothetical protein